MQVYYLGAFELPAPWGGPIGLYMASTVVTTLWGPKNCLSCSVSCRGGWSVYMMGVHYLGSRDMSAPLSVLQGSMCKMCA